MDYRKIQESCKKMSEFSNPEDLFEHLGKYVGELKKRGLAENDIIAHNVIAHGFMGWKWILGSKFPCLYSGSGEKEFERGLYNRFFLRLIRMSAFEDLSHGEKEELREMGWKEYLED